MKVKTFELIYLLLPLVLWPITFILLRPIFIYSMFVSVLILASLTLYKYRSYVSWKKTRTYRRLILAGLLGAVLLYLIFYFGYYLTSILGIDGLVANVYYLIYSQEPAAILIVLLAFIGLFEEIYWRGGIQGYAEKKLRRFKKVPWLASTAYYTCVHITTLNPILVLSAFFVGLVASLIAYRYGIVASAITHIAWIEAVVVFLPIGAMSLI